MSKRNRKPYTESYIRTYKNVIDPRVCEELIHTYEKIWGDNQEEIVKTSLCYNPDGTKFCNAFLRCFPFNNKTPIWDMSNIPTSLRTELCS